MLYFVRISLDKGALILTRLSEEGALKWAFLCLRRDEVTSELCFPILMLISTGGMDNRRTRGIRTSLMLLAAASADSALCLLFGCNEF